MGLNIHQQPQDEKMREYEHSLHRAPRKEEK